MFISKNSLRRSIWLILIGIFLCASHSQAQQQPQTSEKVPNSLTESGESPDTSENRRIERLGEGSTDEWEMDLALPAVTSDHPANSGKFVLPDEDQNLQLQQLLSSLATNPGDGELLTQLNALLADVLALANRLIDAGSINQAEHRLAVIQSVDPGFDGLNAARSRLQTSTEINALVIAGNAALESQRIPESENDSAVYYYKLALRKDPQSQLAQMGLARAQKVLVERALESARELDFETTDIWLSEASSVQENQRLVEDARTEVAKFKQERAAELEQKIISAMNAGNFNLADFTIIDLIALGGHETQVEALRARLQEARHYGGFEPGQIISDDLLKSGGKAPDIVIIAAGSFLMGSQERHAGGDDSDHEKPQHRVTIEHGFGLGVREVSVAEFRVFIQSSGYRTAAELSGSSRVYDEAAGRLSPRQGINWEYDYKGKKAGPELPVLHVSAHDADAYVDWLSDETGKGYRLPSEAEYEFVARAGGKSTYWWGEGSPAETVENLTGERDGSTGKRQWSTFFKEYGDGYWGPGPAGSIGGGGLVHPMGVYDIAGNVSEWTQDCWHQNYMKAPTNGSAWVNPGCDRRVARGGYWASAPEQSRAAFRIAMKADSYGPVVGIRVARDL